MKIGVWVNDGVGKNSGGSFTYYHTLIAAIDDYKFRGDIEVVFVAATGTTGLSKPLIALKGHQKGISLLSKVFRKALKTISSGFFAEAIQRIDKREKVLKDASASTYLKQQGVKLIFYPLPAAQVVDGIPYIINNWDLAHYTTYSFPEITDDNGFERRNDWYLKVMPSALFIFCESLAGKKEIEKHFNVLSEKIKVLPLFSSTTFGGFNISSQDQTKMLTDAGLSIENFFFYPAQFWAHKNHYNLVKAFQQFLVTYPGHKLLFCGSDKGNLPYIKRYVEELGLTNNIIFSGFIDDALLYSLYKNAAALIMPTFLGPTNIPPIEALFLSCPVLCSDIEGHREIMGAAALYFNPADDSSILKSMKDVMQSPMREQLLQDQRERVKTTDHTIEKALIKLETYFIEAAAIRNCWE